MFTGAFMNIYVLNFITHDIYKMYDKWIAYMQFTFFWGKAVCSIGIGAKGLLTCQYTFYLSIYIGPHTFSHSDDDVSSRSDDDDNDDDDS